MFQQFFKNILAHVAYLSIVIPKFSHSQIFPDFPKFFRNGCSQLTSFYATH